jgi:TFIIF-interacting CTD phosphatase-like protein
LPEKKPDGRKYTLVLDLDETLIHFDAQTKQFRSRPYCLSFLRTLSQFFEIVIFTAATKNYADQIIDAIDPNKTLIDYRLYRQHTKP